MDYNKIMREIFEELKKKGRELKKAKESGLWTDRAIKEEREKILQQAREKIRSWKAGEVQKREKSLEAIEMRIKEKSDRAKNNFEERRVFFKSLSTDDLELLADGVLRGEVRLSDLERIILGAELRERARTKLADHLASFQVKAELEDDPEYKKITAELQELGEYGDDYITFKTEPYITESYRLEDVLDGRLEPIRAIKSGGVTEELKKALETTE